MFRSHFKRIEVTEPIIGRSGCTSHAFNNIYHDRQIIFPTRQSNVMAAGHIGTLKKEMAD